MAGLPTSPIRHNHGKKWVLAHLERVLSSTDFRRAGRSSAVLRYIVEQTVDGRASRLKEYMLAVEALGRGASFDPRTDPIVRAEVSRLRTRLQRYYETEGRTDDLVIQLPKGGYVPQFIPRPLPDAPATSETAAAESRGTRPHLPWLVALAGLLAVGALASTWWLRSGAPTSGEQPLLRVDVELAAGTLGSEPGAAFAISTDGTRLVFVARDADGLAHLYTRRLDQGELARIPGTEGARGPFLSPDGRWVGFWADGKMKRAPVEGGSPVVLCDATDLLGASWGAAGEIVAAINPMGRLWVIPEGGGSPRAILDLSTEAARPLWPQILPGGRAVLFTTITSDGADRASIEVLSLRTESGSSSCAAARTAAICPADTSPTLTRARCTRCRSTQTGSRSRGRRCR